jgi:hypothetical protein
MVQVRLVGTRQSVIDAIILLERAHGDSIAFTAPKQGRRGDWLCYGILSDQDEPPAGAHVMRPRRRTAGA